MPRYGFKTLPTNTNIVCSSNNKITVKLTADEIIITNDGGVTTLGFMGGGGEYTVIRPAGFTQTLLLTEALNVLLNEADWRFEPGAIYSSTPTPVASTSPSPTILLENYTFFADIYPSHSPTPKLFGEVGGHKDDGHFS